MLSLLLWLSPAWIWAWLREREAVRARELKQDQADGASENEWEYIAPELLPEWSEAQELLLGRLRSNDPAAEVVARYDFLHVGVLRTFLSRIGEQAGDHAIYWKYGCWFYELTTDSQVLIEHARGDDPNQPHGGHISLKVWGEDTSPAGIQRQEAVDRLEQKRIEWGYEPKLDRNTHVHQG